MAVYDALSRAWRKIFVAVSTGRRARDFGSLDGDSPAAMRYTEARMTAVAEEMLLDIEKETVDFVDNYDGTRKEPKGCFPRVPQLLLNGQTEHRGGYGDKYPAA